jgi:hypothetical protein
MCGRAISWARQRPQGSSPVRAHPHREVCCRCHGLTRVRHPGTALAEAPSVPETGPSAERQASELIAGVQVMSGTRRRSVALVRSSSMG